MATRATTVPISGTTEWSTRRRSTVTSSPVECTMASLAHTPVWCAAGTTTTSSSSGSSGIGSPTRSAPVRTVGAVADTLPGLEDQPADEGLGDTEDTDELEQQSGLGRGLAAIIPT